MHERVVATCSLTATYSNMHTTVNGSVAKMYDMKTDLSQHFSKIKRTL